MLAAERARPSKAAVAGRWTQIGPQPADTIWDSGSVGGNSGRATAIAVDPRDTAVVYLGTAGGGVWKTEDGGQTWTPLTDTQPSLATGALVLDPSSPDTVYVGTGEPNICADCYYGAGILKSIDAGKTWIQLPGPFVDQRAPIEGLAVHPSNGSVLLAAVAGQSVMKSTDGGQSWTSTLAGWPSAVAFDPSDGATAYAALGSPYGDPGNGVFRSTDSGQTWQQVIGQGTSVLPSTIMGRIGLAVDPSNSANVYAAIAPPVSGGNGLPAIFKSTDKGATWVELSSGMSCCSWYNDAIIVSPTNSSVLYVTGFGLLRSSDGGSTWTDISSGTTGVNLHPDQHAMAFSADASQLYVANDGGAFSSSDPSDTAVAWDDLNSTIATITFYPGLSIDPSQRNLSFGGTQDNGSLRYSGLLPWDWVTCGDGMYTAVDSGSPANVYTNCAGIGINKSTFNGEPGTFFSAQNGIDSNDRSGWVSPLAMDPSNPSTLYFGTYRIYQTMDGANFRTPVSPDLTAGGTISTIAVAPRNSNTVYVASADNRVSVTTNANSGSGAAWIDISAGLPSRFITRIAVDPANPMTAYLALGGFSGLFNPSAHVFRTINGGKAWEDISGNLPDIPVNQVVIDPDARRTLYIGTDIGVFYTQDSGRKWHPLVTGLPRVVVNDLALHEASRTLRAQRTVAACGTSSSQRVGSTLTNSARAADEQVWRPDSLCASVRCSKHPNLVGISYAGLPKGHRRSKLRMRPP